MRGNTFFVLTEVNYQKKQRKVLERDNIKRCSQKQNDLKFI